MSPTFFPLLVCGACSRDNESGGMRGVIYFELVSVYGRAEYRGA